jgi:mannitol/fructose-specific phosphotransferase system IIA component (Ntr-type)
MGVAAPHARLPGLQAPVIAAGLSHFGIDFDAPDACPAQLIFLILTPVHDDGAQLEILADIAASLKARELREKLLQVNGLTEFLALVKSGQPH